MSSMNNASKMLNRGRGSAPSSKGVGSMFSGVGGLILFIIVIIVVLLVIYFVATMFTPESGDGVPLLTQPEMIGTKGPQKAHVKGDHSPLIYTYTGWIYVQNYMLNFNQDKILFNRGKPATAGYVLQLASGKNTLMFTNAMKPFSDTGSQVFQCSVDNFPLQTWVHYAVSVNNRNVNIYINGRLQRACVMNGLPVAPTLNTPIEYMYPESQSFAGQMSRMTYYSRELSSSEVYNDYAKGPVPNKSLSLFGSNKSHKSST